jgi:Rrf2 family protein
VKLSHATLYAMRALVYLAKRDDDDLLTAQQVAEACDIPHGIYLRSLLGRLAVAGVVRSKKGPGGGCRLARPPKDITLLEVTEAVDGPIDQPMFFAHEDDDGLHDRLQAICDRASEVVRRHYRKVRLADLVGRL